MELSAVPARRRHQLFALALLVAIAVTCTAPAMPSAPRSSSVTTVDVLDFLVGDSSAWPRIGALYLNQVVDLARQEICWVKYGNPRRFECWQWDEDYVYHRTDNAVDGDTGESYHFSDGRWLPRRVPVSAANAWTLDVADNRLTWFTPQCTVNSARSGTFPYRQRAWLEPMLDTGGDFGIRDTVVLEYAPYDPASGRSNPERFYFARGAGWYRWSNGASDLRFDRPFARSIGLDRSVWCAPSPAASADSTSSSSRQAEVDRSGNPRT